MVRLRELKRNLAKLGFFLKNSQKANTHVFAFFVACHSDADGYFTNNNGYTLMLIDYLILERF